MKYILRDINEQYDETKYINKFIEHHTIMHGNIIEAFKYSLFLARYHKKNLEIILGRPYKIEQYHNGIILK